VRDGEKLQTLLLPSVNSCDLAWKSLKFRLPSFTELAKVC
jgi:hypothetical protein